MGHDFNSSLTRASSTSLQILSLAKKKKKDLQLFFTGKKSLSNPASSTSVVTEFPTPFSNQAHLFLVYFSAARVEGATLTALNVHLLFQLWLNFCFPLHYSLAFFLQILWYHEFSWTSPNSLSQELSPWTDCSWNLICRWTWQGRCNTTIPLCTETFLVAT